MSNILHNATVDTLLERRSIRKFKPKPLPDDVVETLETVAQHAASSQFLNDWSAIRVTDANHQEASCRNRRAAVYRDRAAAVRVRVGRASQCRDRRT